MEATSPLGDWSQKIPGFGRYMIYPVLAAAVIGQWLGMSLEDIEQQFALSLNEAKTKRDAG